jgi:excisionase family DNA binding protein
MNKTDAARLLNVSPRTLQRLSQQGKISVAYKNNKSGAEANYDEAELRSYLEQQSSIIYKPASQDFIQQESLAIRNDDRLITILEALRPRQKPIVPIESKLTLSIVEASALAGLSRQHLLEAIKDKKLKGRIIGRGWRIKKSDLEAYTQKL